MKRYILLILSLGLCLSATANAFNWYSQKDSRWSTSRMGSRRSTSIGRSGCVLSCLSMLLNAEASNPQITPEDLNNWLRQNGGYAGNNMRWQMPGQMDGLGTGMELVKQDNTRNNWKFLSEELAKGNKVIVKVAGRRSHWVLVVKQIGEYNKAASYLVNDPGLRDFHQRSLAHWGGFRAARSYSGNWIDKEAFALETDLTIVPIQNEEFFLYELYEIANPADVFVSVKNRLPVTLKGYFIMALYDPNDNHVETIDIDYHEMEPNSITDLIYELENVKRITEENLKIRILYSKNFSMRPSLFETLDVTRINEEDKDASRLTEDDHDEDDFVVE